MCHLKRHWTFWRDALRRATAALRSVRSWLPFILISRFCLSLLLEQRYLGHLFMKGHKVQVGDVDHVRTTDHCERPVLHLPLQSPHIQQLSQLRLLGKRICTKLEKSYRIYLVWCVAGLISPVFQCGSHCTAATESTNVNNNDGLRFSKASWGKLMVETIAGDGSTIYLSLRCFWKTQPRAL